ncbi:MAG: hypothetical protein ACRC41_05350 [Sarcina sp.]
MVNILKNHNNIDVLCSHCKKKFSVIENGLWICPNCGEKIIVFNEDRILREITWINKTSNIIELADSTKLKLFDFYLNQHLNYKVTHCICPDCNKNVLYKIKPLNLKTLYYDSIFNISNIFTCRKCQRFYASINSANKENNPLKYSNHMIRSKIYPTDKYVDLLFFTNCFS